MSGIIQTKHEKSSLFHGIRKYQIALKEKAIKLREAFLIGFISASVTTRIRYSQFSGKNRLRVKGQCILRGDHHLYALRSPEPLARGLSRYGIILSRCIIRWVGTVASQESTRLIKAKIRGELRANFCFFLSLTVSLIVQHASGQHHSMADLSKLSPLSDNR
jgi:hypothetical protein